MSYRLLSTLIRHRRTTFFFFNDTATTEIYTLSLHDALPISFAVIGWLWMNVYGLFVTRLREVITAPRVRQWMQRVTGVDRKSTRLNSSHQIISYAVFCLKKKTTQQETQLVRHAVSGDARHTT